MNLDSLPRVSLAALPTPVEELPRLSRVLGRRLWIKRDDLTGLAFGGNKTRKLEFLGADALKENADTLVTTGAPQSNHCRQTAAAAAKLGLRCVLVLTGMPRPADSGNLLLDRLLGAELVWAGERPRDRALEETMDTQRRQGRHPYLIPYGGSNTLGAAAYALAVKELAGQHIPADWIFFASSSAGTQAGILLGQKVFGLSGTAVGISVDLAAEPLREKIFLLADRAARDLHLSIDLKREEVRVDDRYLGGGYGVVGDPEREAIRLFAETEGLLLDPVYTGRAAAGLIGAIRKGEIAEQESALFWHTGGTPALWSYSADLFPGKA